MPLENFSYFKMEAGDQPHKAQGKPKDPGKPEKAPGKGGGGKKGPGGPGGGTSPGIRIVYQVLRTTTGTQDFIAAGAGDVVAAIFFSVFGTMDDVATSGAQFSYGATDGTNQWVMCCRDEDGAANVNTDRRASTDEILMSIDVSGLVTGEANFDSFIPDGVRINLTVTGGGAPIIACVLISGSGVSAAVGTDTLTNGGTLTITPGFQMAALLVNSVHSAIDDVGRAHYTLSFGLGAFDGTTISQNSFTYRSSNVQATGDPRCRQISGQIATYHDDQLDATLANITATAFDLTSVGNSSSVTVGYLALAGLDASVVALTMPTSTGDAAFTGAGFQPTFALSYMCMMAADNTEYVDGSAGAWGFSITTPVNQASMSQGNEDASANMDTQGVSSPSSVNLDEDDGTDGYEASFVSFDSDGMTLNFGVVDGLAAATAFLWPTLFIRL